LVEAEFVKEQNQRIFAKLDAIQDAALMRSSSQVPVLWWGGSHPYRGVLGGMAPETNNQAFSSSPVPRGGSRPFTLVMRVGPDKMLYEQLEQE
jgi:hypothetical protein